MTHTDLPAAADMRAKLNTAQNHAAQAQVHDLAVKITRAVEQGKASISVTRFEPGVQALLEQRGYKVTYHPGDPRDQRDGSQYTVRW